MLKRCFHCKAEKPLAEFVKSRRSKDGHATLCRPCNREKSAAFRRDHPEKMAASRNAYNASNREIIAAKQKAYDDANREAKRARDRRWNIENRARRRMLIADRKARVLQQTLPLTPDQRAEMVAIYEEAERLEQETGVPHEVDHMVPLKGKTVCGLHVPWNLRPLSEPENQRKRSRLLPEISAPAWPHAFYTP
jgi:5-methylcytosine-specific restriction endonuclease McrA